MKTTTKRLIRQKGTRLQVKRDLLRKKILQDMRRQNGEQSCEGMCFDYGC
jgi:hypothetical protein